MVIDNTINFKENENGIFLPVYPDVQTVYTTGHKSPLNRLIIDIGKKIQDEYSFLKDTIGEIVDSFKQPKADTPIVYLEPDKSLFEFIRSSPAFKKTGFFLSLMAGANLLLGENTGHSENGNYIVTDFPKLGSSLEFNALSGNLPDNGLKQVSDLPDCNCSDLPRNLLAQEGYGSIGGLYVKLSQDGTKGYINVPASSTLSIDDFLDVRPGATYTVSVVNNQGYRIEGNNIIATENPIFLDLLITGQSKICKDAIRTFIVPGENQGPGGNGDALQNYIINVLASLDQNQTNIKQTLDTFQQTIDSLSKVAPEIRTDTIYIQEQDTAKVQDIIKQLEQKRKIGFGLGYTGHNLNLPASMYAELVIPAGNFQFSLEGVFPTEGTITGTKNNVVGNQIYNELLSANVNQKGQINLSGQYIIPLVKGQENDILTLGLGAYGGIHFLNGLSEIDIQSILINGTSHTNEGLGNQLSMIYSAGPSANFGINLSPVLQLNLGAKYNVLGNAPFDKDVFNQNKTDSYHPFTLQGGATIYLPTKSEKRTGDLK